MRKHLVAALALAAVAIAASAAPAFTGDSGTVTMHITVEAPAAACLTVSPSSLDFAGPAHFSKPGAGAVSDSVEAATLTNCGSASQTVSAVGSDAVSQAGSWTLASGAGNPCALGPDAFFLLLDSDSGGAPLTLGSGFITKTPTLVSPTQGHAWGAGEFAYARFTIYMPCEGSNGAGETKTFTVGFTATVAS